MSIRYSAIITSLIVFFSGTNYAMADSSFSFLYGQKMLSTDWQPVDTQKEMGLLFDFEIRPGYSLAFDILSSKATEPSEGLPLDGTTTEVGAGVRLSNKLDNKLSYYYGLGIAYIYSKYGGYVTNEQATAKGYWLNGGIRWQGISEDSDAFLGLDLRYSSADIELIKITNSGGTHIGFIIGNTF